MKNKIVSLIVMLFLVSTFACAGIIFAAASETVTPCKMESTIDVYAGASYYNNLRNPVVKGDSFKVVSVDWKINRYRKDYRENFAYSSVQNAFAENTTYYLRLTLHSLNYPQTAFSASLDAEDFSGFTVSLKENGVVKELSPFAVDNYDDTHEYIDLIYKVNTGTAANKVAVTGVYIEVKSILVGNSFIFSSNALVQPTNATNQYIEWFFLNGEDGGTNYHIKSGESYLLLEPQPGATPKPGTFTLVAQVPNGKENGGTFATTIKINIVSDMSLKGSASITQDPLIGEDIKLLLSGDVKTLANLKYNWEYKNSSGAFDPVTKVKNYGSISNNILRPGVGLLDKEIRLRITSGIYMGAVVSETKVVKKSEMMKTPCGFVCTFSQSSGISAMINSNTHYLQEFILMKSSDLPTEEQWKTLAKQPTQYGYLSFPTDENGDAIVGSVTYTMYSRFKATDKSNAGTEIISSTYYTGFSCKLNVNGIKLNYNSVEYQSYDTIIVDLKGQSSVTFTPRILTGPSNANEWKKHVWKLTGSETANFYGVGKVDGPYYITLDYQKENEYYKELKVVFTKQGKYYLSADIDGSADRYAYFNIVVIDSTKHIDEYVVSVTPSNITPTSYTIEQNKTFIPPFVSYATIYPEAAQKDYKIIYKEAMYQSGSYGVPYKLVDNAYIDVNETTGAVTGVKKTGSAVSEKGYVVLCKYDTTTQKTTIVSGFTINVTAEAHTHYLSKIDAKNATCTESGYTKTFYVCSCGKWFSDANAKTVIQDHSSCIAKALGHNYGTFIYEKEATHTTDGTIGHYHCSRCNKNFDIAKNELSSIVISHSNHKIVTAKWQYDSKYHWNCCAVAGCDTIQNKAEHILNADGTMCKICNALFEKNGDVIEATPTESHPDSETEAPETTAKNDNITESPIATKAPENTDTPKATMQPNETGAAEATKAPNETDAINATTAPGHDESTAKKSGGKYIIIIAAAMIVLIAITATLVVINKKKNNKE